MYTRLIPDEFLAGLDQERFVANWVRHISDQDVQPWPTELGGQVVAMMTEGPYRDRTDRDPLLNQPAGNVAHTALQTQGLEGHMCNIGLHLREFVPELGGERDVVDVGSHQTADSRVKAIEVAYSPSPGSFYIVVPLYG